MNPDDIGQCLRGGPPPALAPRNGRAPPAADTIIAAISSSYFSLRRGLALLAFALPPLLVLLGGAGRPEASISAYYHADGGELRDLFVGSLWAIGVFLFLYRGYSRMEDWALNGAGVAAIVLALAPIDWPVVPGRTSLAGYLHGGAALLFFLLIAYVCVFRARDTLSAVDDDAARQRFAMSYRMLGIAMVVAPVSIALIHWIAPAQERSTLILGIEWAAIWVFAAFWLIKSAEIRRIEAQRGVEID